MSEKPGRRQGSVPTISDVARQAGVSPMTVSRVINGEPNVRSATREIVKEAITALRYTPNSAARSLAGATATRIGLLYSNPSAGYLSEFLVGSLDQASRSDVQLVVEKCELGDHEIEVARHLIKSGIDGIVLPSPLCDSPRLIEVIAQEDLPAVVVSTGSPDPAMLSVGIDEFAAAHAMTRHIVALGHRRIGFIIGNPAQVASGLRLRGFCAALDEAGIQAEPALIIQGDFTYKSGLGAAERLLSLPERPSAIFASNDDMAAATVAMAHRRGLDVPRDLTVCGFDDTTLATAIWPELTTIRQPIAEMARAALELLISSIRRQRPGDPHRMLAYELIRRQSDAPPASLPIARRA